MLRPRGKRSNPIGTDPPFHQTGLLQSQQAPYMRVDSTPYLTLLRQFEMALLIARERELSSSP